MSNTAEASYRKRMLASQAAELRARGLLHREIADALGISSSYAAELCDDPTGWKSKERKKRYAGACVDCGAPTSGCEGLKPEPRCQPCAAVKSGADNRQWDATRIINAIQEWAHIYGEPPGMMDWNPWGARNQIHDEQRALRWEEADGRWPWFTIVVNRFGTWSNGIEAAGFERRAPNGGGGNMERRRATSSERGPRAAAPRQRTGRAGTRRPPVLTPANGHDPSPPRSEDADLMALAREFGLA